MNSVCSGGLSVAGNVVALELQLACFHTEDAVCSVCDSKVMRDHDESHTELLSGLEEKVQHLIRVLAVKCTGRLVGHDDIGVVDQRTRDSDTLLLTTGKLAREVVQTLAEVKSLNEVTEVLLIAHVGFVTHHRRDEDVLKRGKLRNEVVLLEYESHVLAAEASERVVRQLCDLGLTDLDGACVGSVGAWVGSTVGA